MKEQIDHLVETLKQQLDNLNLVILFGSFATGHQHVDSDIDLAIGCDRPLTPRELFDLTLALQADCNQIVDLVDLRNADVSVVLKNEIMTRGKVVYAVDPDIVSSFEGPIRREAEDFLLRRRDLDEHLVKRLRTYATA